MDDNNPLPPHMGGGRTSRKRGWAGDEMEMNHKIQEKLSSSSTTNNFTAVDLTQFRNEEVGRGYQAKGVVRQNYNEGQTLKVIDMSKKIAATAIATQQSSNNNNNVNDGCSKSCPDDKKRKLKKKKQKTEEKKAGRQQREEEVNLEKYLQCEAIRRFRREIEKIVRS